MVVDNIQCAQLLANNSIWIYILIITLAHSSSKKLGPERDEKKLSGRQKNIRRRFLFSFPTFNFNGALGYLSRALTEKGYSCNFFKIDVFHVQAIMTFKSLQLHKQ